MNKQLCYTFIILLSMGLYACKNESQTGQNVKSAKQANENSVIYKIDTAHSLINWWGYKINEKTDEEASHFGKLKLKEGELIVENNWLQSGIVVADMNTIMAEDVSDQKSKNDLETHLKGSDFFEINKYPTAKFEITQVLPLKTGDFNSEISGNLTIKGLTKNYTLKANIGIMDDILSLNTDDLIINRQEFNLSFSHAGDYLIKNDIKLQISLQARK